MSSRESADTVPEAGESLKTCFPDLWEKYTTIIHSIASMMSESDLSDEDIDVLRRIGKDLPGISALSRSLGPKDSFAMEYLGPVTPHAPFDQRLCDRYLAGPDMSVIVIVGRNGEPSGLIPLGPFTDRFSAFASLKGSNHLIVTDAILYSDENIRALESSGCDFILRMQQFPVSFGPSLHQKMLQLKHDGKEYAACKCRYDKRWLFKFEDGKDADSVRAAVSNMRLRTQESEFYKDSAGHEHAVSDVGHDIREVRELIDTRIRTDRMMGLCRILLSSDDRLLYDRDATVGFILAFILGKRPRFRWIRSIPETPYRDH